MASRADLPDKLYFKIGEVADLTGVKQHVLRYWESEFPAIRPQKSKTNQRLYRRKDIEAVLAIKHLLYDRKFTIEGARRYLREEGVEEATPPPDPEVVAEAAREQTRAEMSEEIERHKRAVAEGFERDLLALRAELVKYVEDLEGEEEE